MLTSSTRRALAALALTAVGVSALSATPASADELLTANTAPTVAGTSFTMPVPQTAFEPDSDESDEVYAYNVTVGDAESLNDLQTVTVCLYQSLKEDATAGEGDNTCTAINPANTVRLTWSQATDAFTIGAGASTFWALDTVAPSTRSGALVDTTAAFVFRFTVSEAMREGTWTAKVTATDITAATDVNATVTALVNAYSAITVRDPQDFGTLAAGAPGAERTDSPIVTSNGATTLSLTAGDFVNGVYSYTLKTDDATSVAPDAGEVTYDCNRAGAFVEGTATRVGSGVTLIGVAGATASGTVEGGVAVSNSCRIMHGGGRPTGTYAFVVVNTIGNA
ncbi:MAG TPA: hypothetical protein VNO51_04550 [Ilumatobacteraceae bacterium]|nr:hypothetical protein [Ilumatobacteraceae bacterium]